MAKKYHPDLNHDSRAPDIFIQIREAYDFLYNYYEEQQLDESEPLEEVQEQKQEEIIQDWVHHAREKVRRQAAYEARMKYENFKKTRAYKTAIAFNKIANLVIFLSGILIIFGSVYGIMYRGLYTYIAGKQTLNWDGIVAAFLTSSVGVIIMVFTYLYHRTHN